MFLFVTHFFRRQMSLLDRFSLKGKVAIITGASRGIGEAFARGFAEAGAAVVLSSRKQEPLDALAADLNAQGYQAAAYAAHAGDLAALRGLIQFTVETFGGIDIVVNNAAISPTFGPVLLTDSEAFDKIIAVNLKGPFELSKNAFPHLKERKGCVLNIASIGGISPEPFMGIYNVSKSALIGLTKVMAREWGQDGVRVNALCPGLVKTKLSQALWTNEAVMQEFIGNQPINEMAMPEDMAGLALLLCSDAGRYCTGGVYLADGGFTI
jgi:dehydrogenase/reductase SDR family member 4